MRWPRPHALALVVAMAVAALGAVPSQARAETQAQERSLVASITQEHQRNGPSTFVLFGATGDLASRMLFPSLFELHRKGELPKGFRIVAASPTVRSQGEFLEQLRTKVRELGKVDVSSPEWKRFETTIVGENIDFADQRSVRALKNQLGDREAVFYLALPPAVFGPAVQALHDSGLLGKSGAGAKNTLVLEKPFGRNLEEARSLGRKVSRLANEAKVLRMDHYLGKQAVLQLMALRFGSRQFESMWNHDYIERVEIGAREQIDIQGRGSFYDQTGAMKDFVQGHLMQVLSIVAMDAPERASELADAKAAVVRKIKPVPPSATVRGQYQGYARTPGVQKGSATETYVALRTEIENSRWRGVPFVLESGKALAAKDSYVRVSFKKLAPSVARALGVPADRPAQLVIHIDPKPEMELRSGSRSIPITAGASLPNRAPYERLLLAAVEGNHALFAKRGEVEASWAVIDPVERQWKQSGQRPLTYKIGVARPRAATSLLPSRLLRTRLAPARFKTRGRPQTTANRARHQKLQRLRPPARAARVRR